MTTVTALDPIVRSVRVKASPERAFEVFTSGLGRWWPSHYSIGSSPLTTAVMEPRAGGRWYEIGADGSECPWGEVLAWEPPLRLVLAWRIQGNWSFDPTLLTEVEVTFSDVGGGETEVTLEHRKLENLGEGAESAAQTFASEGGWSGLLRGYSEVLAHERQVATQ